MGTADRGTGGDRDSAGGAPAESAPAGARPMLDYETPPRPRRGPRSRLAVLSGVCGCAVVLPVLGPGVYAAIRLHDPRALALAFFAPPAIAWGLAALAIIRLRRRPGLGGIGACVLGFWASIVGLFSALLAWGLLSGGLG